MKNQIGQEKLHQESQGFLTQSQHMQIIGNPKLIEARKGFSVIQLQTILKEADLELPPQLR